MQSGSIIYDPDTGIFTSLKGKVKGTLKEDGYLMVWHEGKSWRANRLAYYLMTGELPECVDHINGIITDNRFVNLRAASKSENAWNSKRYETNTSGHKGVHFCKSSNMWRVEIWANGKRYRPRFKTIEEACTEVDRIRKLLHKEFANAGT